MKTTSELVTEITMAAIAGNAIHRDMPHADAIGVINAFLQIHEKAQEELVPRGKVTSQPLRN
jgi:hypothetical protein